MVLLSGRPLFRASLIAALVIALVIVASVARMTGWSAFAISNPAGPMVPKAAVSSKPGLAHARRMCAACGVVASMREVVIGKGDPLHQPTTIANVADAGNKLGKSATKYEITVSMSDGSSRVFEETDSSNWRVGGRLIFIDAGNSPD